MDNKKRYHLFLLSFALVCIIFLTIILLTPIFFKFVWNDTLRYLLGGATYLFRFMTEFGGTLIYLAVFFTLYWGINKKLARNLLIVYVASNVVNYYGKSIIGRSRPPESNWLLISASHLSTPSGHAQSSTVFWGFIAIKSRRIIMWILCIGIIILVGLSRLYLGVHWFGDILAGWLFGVLILDFTLLLEGPIRKFTDKYNISLIYLGIAFIGLITMILTEVLFPIEYNFGTVGGQLMGLGIGFALEERFINFNVNPDSNIDWKIILRISLGILFIAAVYLLIYLLIDTEIFWMNALHYIVTFLIGIVIWPAIFKKLHI